MEKSRSEIVAELRELPAFRWTFPSATLWGSDQAEPVPMPGSPEDFIAWRDEVTEGIARCLADLAEEPQSVEAPRSGAGDTKVAVVVMDDWQGLYVDGDLVFENHRVEPGDLARAGAAEVLNIEDPSFLRHVEVNGGMPRTLVEARRWPTT